MSNTITEIEGLLARARDGDEAAREALVWCAWERRQRLAHRMLRDFPRVRIEAETGDIVCRATEQLQGVLFDPAYPPPSSALHFFRLVALLLRRELLDLARCCAKRPNLVPWPDGRPDPDGSSGGFEPPEATDCDRRQAEVVRDLLEAIDRLPEPLRAVVDLRFFQGLSQAEAAAALGNCSKTVRKSWIEARLRLSDALGGRLSGP
jgi:DNA-directed RNA polymerase specialized sigma24 family protein